MYVSKYFKDSEFERVHCLRSDVDDDSLRRLDRAREIAGIPFILNCAFRSKETELEKGRSGNSAHTRGRAFDVRCANSLDRWKMLHAALAAGFTRIGIYPTFLHFDDDPTLPTPRVWIDVK